MIERRMRECNSIGATRPLLCTVLILATVAFTGPTLAQPSPEVAQPREPAAAKAADVLLRPWGGPYGGLPPFDQAAPESIEIAYRMAIESKRAEVNAIASNPAPPTFENTIAALEDSGRPLQRIKTVFGAYSANMSTGSMPAVAERLAPLLPKLEGEILHNEALFARINEVYAKREKSALTIEQQRLTQVIRERFLRGGAGLAPAAKQQLERIDERLATVQNQFGQNLLADESTQAVFLDNEASLDGLDESARAAASAAATAKGRSGGWAIPNARPAVWGFLTHSTRRDLREKVWRMWTMRGDHPGERDNKPVVAEILRLRGERARLLGYPDYAHMAIADHMARTPDAAMALLQDVWKRVMGPTRALVAQLQKIADADGANFKLAPWDRLYYTEKLRRERFGFDSEAVKPYLALDSVLNAMFWAAGRVHELSFKEIHGAPVYQADVRAFEVSRAGEPIGVLYFDLLQRPGKGRGSWSTEYRTAESFRGRVLPIATVISSVARPADGGPVLLTWSEAGTWFHEFGHVLHMLSSRARYPSLDSLAVPWDFVEAPALLNERWFRDRELLSRFARHYKTGEAIPITLLEEIERAERFERVFTLNLDYLAPAIVDLKMHLLANGREIDAVKLEKQVLTDLGMPEAWDEIMRIPNNVHSFSSSEYAAGIYGYLWADGIAADVAEAFTGAPGGLYDQEIATRWRNTLLSVGDTVPIEDAFRNFRGRDPSPAALLKRFDLQ